MSLQTMIRVWQHSRTRGAMRCLMLAIADLANDDGIAWPGTAKLAEKINEAEDYTDVIIKKCIDLGELVKVSGRGRGHKTRFAVLCGLDASAQKALKGVLQNPYSRTPNTKRGTTKGVLQSEKRGTFPNAKHRTNGATGSDETAIVKNDTLHDPTHGDGDGTRTLEKKLLAEGMYPATVRQIMALDLDPDTVITSVNVLLTAGWGPGAIADRLRTSPPDKGKPYERPNGRPVQLESAPRPSRRSAVGTRNPDRDAEYAAQLAAWERQAAERGTS